MTNIEIANNYNPIVASYSGEGLLQLKGGIEYKCDFSIVQYGNGKIVLKCVKNGIFDIMPEIIGFEGMTQEGGKIICKGFVFLEQTIGSSITYKVDELFEEMSLSEQTQEYRFGITNFEFFGLTPEWNNVRGYRVLPLLLEWRNKKIEVVIKPIETYNKTMKYIGFYKTVNVTCEAVVPFNSFINDNEMYEILRNLCYIMSVARGTKISWIYCKSYDNSDKCIKSYHCDHVTKRLTPLPAIDSKGSGRNETKIFIERAYNELFTNPEDSILDKTIIDKYLDAKAEGDNPESRALKLAVTMEMIKDKFKNNLAGLGKKSFKTIIMSICSQIGMIVSEIGIDSFVNSRNSLVHTGTFYYTTEDGKKVYSSEQQEFFFLLNFMDRIFLKALKYEGIYIDWSVPGEPERTSLS